MKRSFVLLLICIVMIFSLNSQDFDFIRQKAEEGNPVAQTRLGIYYYQGKNVEKNPETAFEWFMKGANQGFPLAQYYVGAMYRFGNGVEKDLKKAIIWFTKASNQNQARAQYMLAAMYYLGLGTDRDLIKAYYFYKLAERNKVKKAELMLNELKNIMSRSQIDKAEKMFLNRVKQVKKPNKKNSTNNN
ncbi:MAG: sel1 repeat family protein [Candidatus Mcinerneyibacterium aminivorans]|uniref:Sel1 repeat family protein n=1 Tax=Candidatus Mcinerneyibacterium aminivorans TaxID=2703815 RepID=A0A5D0MGB8_9BACT|nr:MAG: sel1 repeat family protein [Candidatus Mcinerneyibacterium aminivorans]